MDFIVIIPARFSSTRFPGKPLALLGGKPVIQWVYENASAVVDHVWVATDDDRIANVVAGFGGKSVITSANLPSGTDRCAAAAALLERTIDFDVVINLQGDEPFVQSEQINQLMACFQDKTDIATLVKRIETLEELFNPNRPKVVLDVDQKALYFSRSPIPYRRSMEKDNWLAGSFYWAHIGMYAYRKEVLQEITRLPSGKLEQMESLEQLRWLENGYSIQTAVTRFQSIGIDTPEDLSEAEKWVSQ